MEIYIGCINDYTTQYLGELVSDERIRLADRYRFEADRKRTLLAHALLNHAVSVHNPDIRLPVDPVTDRYGKHHIYTHNGCEEIFFSLSHSGDYAICALNSEAIGADIEKIGNGRDGIAERFFASDEKKFINDTASFFKIWTLKESFIKAVGLGMRIPMDSFSVCDLNEETGTCAFRRCEHDFDDDIKEIIDRNMSDRISGYFNISGMTLDKVPGYSLSCALCNIQPDMLSEPQMIYPVL